MKKEEESKLNLIYTRWHRDSKCPAEKVGWSCLEDQTSRFEQFLEFQNITKKKLEGASILDVGCGDGEFLKFLRDKLNTEKFEYFGIDANGGYIKKAKERFDAEFVHGNFMTYDFDRKFDFSFASGIFNVNVFEDEERAYEVMFQTIEKMLEVTKVGAMFNFLSKKEAEGFILSGNMMIYDAKRVMKWAGKKNPKKLELIEGYDAHDSTILILK